MKNQNCQLPLLIIILICLSTLSYLSIPNPPMDKPIPVLTLTELWENRVEYAHEQVILKNVFIDNGEYFLFKGMFEISDKTGTIQLRVLSDLPPPRKGDILRKLKVYIKPITASEDGDDFYLLQEIERY